MLNFMLRVKIGVSAMSTCKLVISPTTLIELLLLRSSMKCYSFLSKKSKSKEPRRLARVARSGLVKSKPECRYAAFIRFSSQSGHFLLNRVVNKSANYLIVLAKLLTTLLTRC